MPASRSWDIEQARGRAEDCERAAILPQSPSCSEAKVDDSEGAAMLRAANSAEPCAGAAGAAFRREIRSWRRAGAAALAAAACLAIGALTLGLAQSGRTSQPSSGAGLAGAGAGTAAPLSARQVAETLQAYARQGAPPSEKALEDISTQAQEVVSDMTARDVAATLDSYARLGRQPAGKLLASLGQRAQRVVGDMDAQDVTDTINAYAELGQQITAPGSNPRNFGEELAREAAAVDAAVGAPLDAALRA